MMFVLLVPDVGRANENILVVQLFSALYCVVNNRGRIFLCNYCVTEDLGIFFKITLPRTYAFEAVYLALGIAVLQ